MGRVRHLCLLVGALLVSGCIDSGYTIFGRIVDDAGAPRHGIEVRGGDAIEFTDVDGLFEIATNCEPGKGTSFELYGDGPAAGDQREEMFVTIADDVGCGAVEAGTLAFWHAGIEATEDGQGLQWQPVVEVPEHDVHYLVGNESFRVSFDTFGATFTAIDRRIFQDFDFFLPDIYSVFAESIRSSATTKIERVRFDPVNIHLELPPFVPDSRGALCKENHEFVFYPCPATDGDYIARVSVWGLTIDLEETTSVTAIAFIAPSLYDQRESTELIVAASLDGETFEDVGTVEVFERGRGVPSVVLELATPVEARFIRTRGHDVAVGEVSIF